MDGQLDQAVGVPPLVVTEAVEAGAAKQAHQGRGRCHSQGQFHGDATQPALARRPPASLQPQINQAPNSPSWIHVAVARRCVKSSSRCLPTDPPLPAALGGFRHLPHLSWSSSTTSGPAAGCVTHYQEMSLTKVSVSWMPALASTMQERESVVKSEETTSSSV